MINYASDDRRDDHHDDRHDGCKFDRRDEHKVDRREDRGDNRKNQRDDRNDDRRERKDNRPHDDCKANRPPSRNGEQVDGAAVSATVAPVNATGVIVEKRAREEELLRGVCKGIVMDAMQTNCGHLFCLKCLQQVRTRRSQRRTTG